MDAKEWLEKVILKSKELEKLRKFKTIEMSTSGVECEILLLREGIVELAEMLEEKLKIRELDKGQESFKMASFNYKGIEIIQALKSKEV